MYLYTSYGTYQFLNQIKLNHQERSLFQFSTNDSSIILEESEGKSILKHPSAYQVIDSTGEFSEHHFYSAIFVPTSEDHRQQLEKKLLHVDVPLSNFGGFKSYRLLKPTEGSTYKIYFGFANRTAYEDFKASDIFNENFSKDALSQYFGASGQHSSYFERYLYPIEDH
ncbi:MAG: signal transduction protein TRAP [Staphylococcus epidermidis]|nr:signal transduction protein TRAP [Staphylococcus epidermidis]